MHLPRVRFSMRLMMIAVAVAALAFAGERLWRRRQSYLGQAALHANMEAFHADLASDLIGDPRMARSQTVTALLPDGTAVKFGGHGPGLRLYYPPDATTPADEVTVARLSAMCRREAEREGQARRLYERAARYPWLRVRTEPTPPD